MTKAKIIATIGPASRRYGTIRDMISAGTRVIRLNFSHGNRDEHHATVTWARKASEELDTPIAIFQDLQGPKIRVGELKEPYYDLERGDVVSISTKPMLGTHKLFSIDYPTLHEEISPGHRMLIDDGLISLIVEDINGEHITARVTDGGRLKPRKGVNLPGIALSRLSSFTEKDCADLSFAFEHKLDYVALSFVRSAEDVKALRAYMLKTFDEEIPIISKIEKPEAVEDIDQIIESSSAVMVARGDLGIETSPEEVPIIQKRIIRSCNLAGVPVITATQMLESMISNPRPTRAEAGDVANAILDGTSAVMLSGETAAGTYPLQSVEMMHRIVSHTEQSEAYQRIVLDQRLNREDIELKRKKSTTEAVGLATRELALAIRASYIASFTHSGGSARLVSKFRPGVPIIGFSPIQQTVQRLALSWGVTPLLVEDLTTVDDLLDYASEHLKSLGLVRPGDTIVITAGVPVGSPGKTNMIKVVEIS